MDCTKIKPLSFTDLSTYDVLTWSKNAIYRKIVSLYICQIIYLFKHQRNIPKGQNIEGLFESTYIIYLYRYLKTYRKYTKKIYEK